MNIIREALDYLSKRSRHSEHMKQLSAKYVNLAPTDKADEDWIYFAALNKAIGDPDVYNIALTGPYGSGKSSVIKSFLKRYKRPVLEISLASFLPEADRTGSMIRKQEIERSILQQMLYGSDANRLPLSRFKRIRAPSRWNWAVSLLILLGCMALWRLFQNRVEILSGDFFVPFDFSNGFNLATFAFGFIFLWQVLHRIYLKSFGVSLKSISLTDVEITPETAKEESILNRHLDEIIYFFQSTKYELVIIEDLDRFNNPDIFVTLREINSLINANFAVKRKVRFLYALRDDIFTNTDRTKFFEFIVPVIPIINHSNSIDMILEEGHRLSSEKKFDQQFLREVSRYLNDLRLIKNIFNEYVTYDANLETKDDHSLDPNKLLAVLIYKNVQPSDFEKLHQQKGALAGILSLYEEFVSSAEADLRSQISEIEERVAEADKQYLKTLGELRKIYAMAVVEHMPQNHSIVMHGATTIPIQKLADHDQFEEIIVSTSLLSRTTQGHQTQLDLTKIRATVDPQKTYLERKSEIELKSDESRKKLALETRDLRSKMASIRIEKFSNIIRANTSHIQGNFSEFGESEDLVKYLIFEGFLDDTYYQYISLFHTGRLSPSDNKFLIQIRSFNNPDPGFRLDNQAEVIAMMREEDFDQCYALNRYLMDEMLEHIDEYETQVDKVVKYIAGNFAQCSAFFTSYYANGKHVTALVNTLAERWGGFASAAAETSLAVEHIANIVECVPTKFLVATVDVDNVISSFLGTNLSSVLEEKEDIDLRKLESLDIEVEDISTLISNQKAFRFVIDNSLYRISINNLRVVLEHLLDADDLTDLDVRHFTTILRSRNDDVCRHVEENFSAYLQNVLLQMEKNTQEEIETVQRALEHDEVSQDLLEEFLLKQDVIFPSLNLIPQGFHSAIFDARMIDATWENVLSYCQIEGFKPDVLTIFMQSPNEKDRLLQDTYARSDQTIKLSRFILNNEDFSDVEYRRYLQKLPVTFKNFPNAAPTLRRIILVEEGVISLTEEVFQAVRSDEDLVECLLVNNIEKFVEDRSKYPIDDTVREKLLTSIISDNQKLSIIEDIDLATVPENASMAGKIGSVFNRVEINFEPYSFDFVRSILLHSTPVTAKISLFNKCHKVLTSDQVRQILEELPEPYSEISGYWRTPRIPNARENRALVAWLEEREIISSSSLTLFEREIRVNTFRKLRS